MQRETSSNNKRAHALGIATALMCALAGGAVWCLLSLYSRSDLAAFAFVVALLIAWALQVASLLGLSMRATLQQMEPAMAFDIARANLSGSNALIVACAVALSIVLMLRGGPAKPN